MNMDEEKLCRKLLLSKGDLQNRDMANGGAKRIVRFWVAVCEGGVANLLQT